jgi:hypothetical protein
MEREPFGLLVPAYVPPPEHWEVLLAAGRKLAGGLITVANPSSGPGDHREQAYVDVIKALHERCTSVVGYVHDSFGQRASTLVFEDIDKWFGMYEVDGIFIDELADQQLAVTLVSRVRNGHAGSIVILNPGTIPPESFVEATDPAIIVIQEQAASAYESNWPSVAWVQDRIGSSDLIPADRLAIIAHSAPSESDVEALINVASTYRIGWVFVQNTPGSSYNQFSTWLPTLGDRLQCARAKSPLSYFTCKALGGIPCMVRQLMSWPTRR